jgi:hypothetical protein
MRKIGKFSVLVIMGMLLGMSLLPGQAAAFGEDTEVIVTLEGNKVCMKVTFEHAITWNPIGGYIPGADINMPGDWFVISEGPYENEPSPENIALWLTGYTAEIFFNVPICAVSLFYASTVDVTLTAYDQDGNILTSTWGQRNYYGGMLSVWDPIGMDVGQNIITRVIVHGAAMQTFIDDLKISRLTDLQFCSIAVNPDDPSPTDPPTISLGDETVTVAVLSSDVFDTSILDTSSVRLNDPGSDTAVAPVSWEETDVDGDGRIDISMVFITPDLKVSGGLDEYTIQLQLTGTMLPDPIGQQTAVERLEETRQRLIEKDNNGKAVEKLSEVVERLDDSYGIIGVADVQVTM